MSMRSWLCGLVAALACLGFGEPAAAQAPEVRPAADWIVPLSARDVGPAATGAGVEVVALDDQLRFGGEGTVEKYRLNRTRVTTEAGLAAVSTVSIEWDPSRETVAVHAIRILRGDRVIDVLADQSFEVLRREAGLEAALMTGWLTATLQPRDLRVGDVLETAYTIRGEGGALAPHREALVSANYDLPIGRYRLRATWPADRPVRIGALSPWETVQPRRVRDQWVYEVQADDLQPVFVPEDLPVRFSMIRAVQFTDHAGWGDIVGQMQPLYDRAAMLDPGSPLLAEIERIRGTHATDHDRASAVLRLVQDEVRYLALAMGEGGYVPASADEVWRSRYGDCKGKTVLLLALLRGLGIEADAALVSTGHGDGLDSRLPLVAWFDHVIVRVVIDGQVFWIDGASLGDRAIADVVPPPYAWALPIRPGVEALESIVQPEARVPALDQIFEVDNTNGLDAEAPFRLETRYAGATALFMREAAGALSREQLLAQATAGRDPTRSVMRVTDIEPVTMRPRMCSASSPPESPAPAGSGPPTAGWSVSPKRRSTTSSAPNAMGSSPPGPMRPIGSTIRRCAE